MKSMTWGNGPGQGWLGSGFNVTFIKFREEIRGKRDKMKGGGGGSSPFKLSETQEF